MQQVLNTLLAVALLAGSAAAHAVVVALTPSAASVAPGASFTLDVDASDLFAGLDPLDEVLAFGFDVVVSDPARAVFTGATVGAAFDDDSALITGTDVAGSAFPGVTSAAIRLATLTFQAGAPGAVALSIRSRLSDPNHGLTYLLAGQQDLGGSVTVTVVPEPSTLLLLVAGIVALAGFRRLFPAHNSRCI